LVLSTFHQEAEAERAKCQCLRLLLQTPAATAELLEFAKYPVRDVNQHPFGKGDTDIQAVLYGTSVEAVELYAVMVTKIGPLAFLSHQEMN